MFPVGPAWQQRLNHRTLRAFPVALQRLDEHLAAGADHVILTLPLGPPWGDGVDQLVQCAD